MVTEERYIFDATTNTTDLGQFLPRFGQMLHVLPSDDVITMRFSFVRTRARTLLETIFDDLERLGRRTNYLFKPSTHAMRSAKFYIFETYARMGHAFPRPSFVLDGERGIIIKWTTANGYSVRLNCLPADADEDYIYFENGQYDVEDNVTVETLENRLNWLIQHEREPAR